MTSKPTVFVVDDDLGARDSLAYLITSAGLPVESYASAEEFLNTYDPEQPGCLVLDVRMPTMSGTELHDHMRAHGIGVPVIFLTAYATPRMAADAMKTGAVYFLEKPFKDKELLRWINVALEQDREDREQQAQRRAVQERWDRCTTREREVAQLIVAGESNKQIAHELARCQKTIEAHRKHLYRKMEARSAVELMQLLLLIDKA